MYKTLVVAALLLINLYTFAEAEQVISAAEQREIVEEIEVEIERARQQIDAAARELASLHTKKYALGSNSNKAMLGVLLDGHDEQGGLQIVGVTPGGGAAAAGLQAGDRIVAISGVSVEEDPHPRKALAKVMQNVAAGDDVTVFYLRDGEPVETTVTTQARAVHMITLLDEQLGEKALDLGSLTIDLKELGSDLSAAVVDLPHIERQVWVQHSSSKHALMSVSGPLAKYFDVDEGVIVHHVADSSELQPGDVLLNIAGNTISNLEQAAHLLDNIEGDTEAQIKRHGRKRTVTVQPDDLSGAAEQMVKRVIRVSEDVEVVKD